MLPGNNKGSFTLEATIVFSAVFLVVISIIYCCLMLYEQVYLQSFVDRIATRAANNWSYTNKDMLYGFISKESLNDNSLYWRIWDPNENTKTENIKKFAKYDFGKFSLICNKNNFVIDVNVSRDYVIFKKITITATSSGKNPLGNLLSNMGLKSIFSFNAHSTAVINEPSEFIRNTDFAIDTLTEYDNKYGDSKLQNFSQSIKERISKIFATINKFLE